MRRRASSRERRASTRRGSVIRTLRSERRTSFSNKRTHNQERRASARRGCRNTFAQTQARLFGRPPTVYVRIAVALALNRYHGGLTPPALVLVYGRLRAKKRFLRCANAHSQERRASARRGCRNTFAQTQASLFGRPPTVYVRIAIELALNRYHGGLTPPLLCWCTDVCERKNDFCDVRTPIRNSGGRQPAVRVGNTFAQTQAHLFDRPPTVYLRIAVALAL